MIREKGIRRILSESGIKMMKIDFSRTQYILVPRGCMRWHSFIKLSSLAMCPIASFVHPISPVISSTSLRTDSMYCGLLWFSTDFLCWEWVWRGEESHYLASNQKSACVKFCLIRKTLVTDRRIKGRERAKGSQMKNIHHSTGVYSGKVDHQNSLCNFSRTLILFRSSIQKPRDVVIRPILWVHR